MIELRGDQVAAAVVKIHQPYVHGPLEANIYQFDIGELWCAACSTRWPCSTTMLLADMYPAHAGGDE